MVEVLLQSDPVLQSGNIYPFIFQCFETPSGFPATGLCDTSGRSTLIRQFRPLWDVLDRPYHLFLEDDL